MKTGLFPSRPLLGPSFPILISPDWDENPKARECPERGLRLFPILISPDWDENPQVRILARGPGPFPILISPDWDENVTFSPVYQGVHNSQF